MPRAATTALVLLLASASIPDAAEPPVTGLAFTPDGKSVVVGSQAGVAVHSWPMLNRQRRLDTVSVNIHDVAFSPDGRLLAVAGGIPSEEGLVEIFSWPSGESSAVLRGHDDCVLAVMWIGNSSLATASLDHEVAVWDVKQRDPVRRLKGHSRGVSSLCFLAEEKLLVSGSLDQSLRVWDSESGERIRSLKNHTQEVHQLAERPGGSGLPMVASVSRDQTVRLWQPTIGRMVRFAKLDSEPLAVVWLPNGSLIAVASADGCVRLVDPDTTEIVETIPALEEWAYSLAVHPKDGSLLAGGRNGTLKQILPKTSGRK